MSYRLSPLLGATSALALLMLASTACFAQNTRGFIEASLALTPACLVNNGAVTSNGSGDFGSFDFGEAPMSFGQRDAALLSSAGEGIAVRCSMGTQASLRVLGGSNDANASSTQHALANTSAGAHYIPYELYLDSGRTQVLHNGTAIVVTGDGSSQKIALYARAFSTTGIAAGLYSDLLTLQLDF
ncbi:Csu type fimbrial protein [Pseudomonas sp. X10]